LTGTRCATTTYNFLCLQQSFVARLHVVRQEVALYTVKSYDQMTIMRKIRNLT